MSRSYIQEPFSPALVRRRSKTATRELIPQKQQPPKKTHRDLEQQITANHQAIQSIIGQLELILEDKLQTHQTELLKVFRMTLDKINKEVQEKMAHYAKLAAELNLSTQLANLKNELSYFRHEALTLFETNRQLNTDIKSIRQRNQQLIQEMSIKDQTIAKLTKKILKYKQQIKAKDTTLLDQEKILREKQAAFTANQNYISARTITEPDLSHLPDKAPLSSLNNLAKHPVLKHTRTSTLVNSLGQQRQSHQQMCGILGLTRRSLNGRSHHKSVNADSEPQKFYTYRKTKYN